MHATLVIALASASNYLGDASRDHSQPSFQDGHQDDADYPSYERFLRNFRPQPADRRRLNSHSSERFAVFKENLRKIEAQRKRDPGAWYMYPTRITVTGRGTGTLADRT